MNKKLLLLGLLSSTICLADHMAGVFGGLGEAIALIFFGMILVVFAIAMFNGWILFRLFLKDARYSLERSSWVQFIFGIPNGIAGFLGFFATLSNKLQIGHVIAYMGIQTLIGVLVYRLFFPRISAKNSWLMALITGPLNDLIIGALFFLFLFIVSPR